MKYNAPYGSNDPGSPYQNGNPATGARGSIPPAQAIEHPQREIVHVITWAGMTPDINDLEQLRKAIQQMIVDGGGGGGGGGGGPYLLLAGGAMNADADVAFSGAGDPIKAGVPYWHPTNDGPGSGLDADLLDGIQGNKFVRNDTDAESLVNNKVKVARETAEGNRGVVRILGRDSQPGGGRIEFLNGAGDALNFMLYHSTDRRTVGGQQYSDNGATFEDQFRFTDDGDLWLRKLNSKIGAISRVHYAATVSGTNDLTISDLSPAVTAYYPGMILCLKLPNTNTDAMRANVNALGLKDIKRPTLAAIEAGCARQNAMLIAIYDGTQFQALAGLAQRPNSESTTLPWAVNVDGYDAFTLRMAWDAPVDDRYWQIQMASTDGGALNGAYPQIPSGSNPASSRFLHIVGARLPGGKWSMRSLNDDKNGAQHNWSSTSGNFLSVRISTGLAPANLKMILTGEPRGSATLY